MSCPQVFKATSYTNTGTLFLVNVNTTVSTLINGKGYQLITCANLPAITTVVPVYIAIGDNTYPVLDCLGNSFMSDQLDSRMCYSLVFGSNPAHFKLCRCSCKSVATPSTVDIPTST